MDLSDPRFHDDDKAREWLEAQRWPEGPICPHCGNSNPEKITRLEGKAHRAGLYQCAECREQFTVTVGSVMERSKIPLRKWVMAMHLLGSSKKGMSSHQLHRMLGITYQSAWFLAHRIREAMKETTGPATPIGGKGSIVEADETYIGKRETPRPRSKYATPPTKRGKGGGAQKRIVIGLVERGGKSRMFHVHRATKADVGTIVRTNVSRESRLHTDESNLYPEIGAEFKGGHETVKHSVGEYVRDDVHTNTIEGVFSIFKRGMKGVYQHCGEAHLHRYHAEFDFRYNRRTALGVTDVERVEDIARGTEGKRLLYKAADRSQNA